jgi:hypothetical protein
MLKEIKEAKWLTQTLEKLDNDSLQQWKQRMAHWEISVAQEPEMSEMVVVVAHEVVTGKESRGWGQERENLQSDKSSSEGLYLAGKHSY